MSYDTTQPSVCFWRPGECLSVAVCALKVAESSISRTNKWREKNAVEREERREAREAAEAKRANNQSRSRWQMQQGGGMYVWDDVVCSRQWLLAVHMVV